MFELCRICLVVVNKSNSVSISLKLQDKPVITVIKECSSIQVLEDDILPKYICTKCLEKLNYLYSFRKLIITSDQELKANLKRETDCSDSQDINDVGNASTLNQSVLPENSASTSHLFFTEEPVPNVQNTADESIKNSAKNKRKKLVGLKARLYKKNKAKMLANTKLVKKKKKKYECKICKKVFGSCYSLNKHTVDHTGVDPFTCEFCGKGFCMRWSLKVHVRSHTGDRPFICDVCDKSFGFASGLIIHKKTHSGIKPYACDLCNKTFYQSGQLQIHRRRHTGEKPFMCEICSKTFGDQSSLGKHVQRHQGLEDVCPICGKHISKLSLTRHIKRHAGLKPFSCNKCQSKFSTRQSLKIHMYIHGGVKLFKCQVCSKSFTQGSSLSKHMRIHSGDRPFQCLICTKDFVYKHHLQGHMKNVHKEALQTVTSYRDNDASDIMEEPPVETSLLDSE